MFTHKATSVETGGIAERIWLNHFYYLNGISNWMSDDGNNSCWFWIRKNGILSIYQFEF